MNKIVSTLGALVLILSLGITSGVVLASDNGPEVVLFEFSAEGRPEFVDGSVVFDGENLIVEFTAVGQNAKPEQTNKYTAIWFDRNILDKLPGTSYDEWSFALVNNWFTRALDDPLSLSWRYSIEGGGNPWGGWSGAPSPIYSNHPAWPEGLSFEYEIVGGDIKWTATVPISLLGVEPGDTFGMIVQARDQNTDLSPALSLNSWPALEYGHNAPYDLRNYALVTIPAPPIDAIVEIHPETLNLRAQGRWISAYIELPDPHAVEDIDIETVELQYEDESLDADWGDVQNGVLMVKFDRATVAGWLEGLHDEEVELTVTGKVNDTPFEGMATIRVISPGRGRP